MPVLNATTLIGSMEPDVLQSILFALHPTSKTANVLHAIQVTLWLEEAVEFLLRTPTVKNTIMLATLVISVH